MEFIDVDMLVSLGVEVHLLNCYRDLNSFLLATRPENAVTIGIHARAFAEPFPYDDYFRFCRICEALTLRPYVNFRHLTYIGDFLSVNATRERAVSDGNENVVVAERPWAEEGSYTLEQIYKSRAPAPPQAQAVWLPCMRGPPVRQHEWLRP